MNDKRNAWAATLAGLLAGVAVAANQFTVPPAMGVLMEELHLDMVTGGWLMSLIAVASIVLSIPAAFWMARAGAKRAGLLALGCSVAGAVMGALAPTAGVLLASRALEGVGIALIGIAIPSLISQWFEPKQRGLPMGIWAAWVPLGNVLMFNLAPMLLRGLGWRSEWWLGGLLSLGAMAVFALVVRAPVGEALAQAGSRAGKPVLQMRHLLQPTAWLLALCFCALSFCVIGYNTWAPTYLHAALQVDAAAASSYASLLFAAGIVANMAAGWMLDHGVPRYRLLQAAFLATGVVFFWSFRLPSVAAVAPYMLALGTACNLAPTPLFTLASESMGGATLAGLAIAVEATGSNMGVLAGPPALGAVISGGHWSAGSWVLSGGMAIGLATALLAERTARRGRREASG